MATILLKKRDTTGAPSAGDLTNSASGAEVAVNTYDKRLYSKDSGGNVVELGTAPSTIDINAGTIDGATIGANSASTGAFTTLTSSSTTTLNGTTIPASKTLVVTTDIGTSVQAYDAQLADIAGLTPTDNGVIIGNGTNFVVESGATLKTSLGLTIGTDVQAYDADTAKTDTAQTFTASQRGTVTTDNDLSFNMATTNNFKCTPTGTGSLTFTNITAGQSGFILLVNSGGYTISAAATTKVSTTALATISAAGTYLLSYFSDGTNVYVVNSGALA